ncbi:ComEC/Rec2 family competence protein [Acetobacter cibinongensis]|nr:ComEC/Rec2 family competence protein [Acetobacter cibinongensis]
MLPVFDRMALRLLAEYRRLVLWVPVAVAAGSEWYFALQTEPSALCGLVLPLGVACVSSVVLWMWRGTVWGRVLGTGCAAVAIGFASAWVAAHRHAPMPELPRRAIELSGTIRRVTQGVAPKTGLATRTIEVVAAQFETPLDSGMAPLRRSLRLKLKPDDTQPLFPGDTVWLRAMLTPPPFPAYPGGRDMQREAWFADLAGYGRVLDPVERLNTTTPRGIGFTVQLEPVREALDQRIRAVLPGAVGAVATTLLTGETASIPQTVRQEFAVSGLAHVLAVAGLHLGLVMTVIMVAARLAFARWEWASLRWPCKALSAFVALGGGVGYAALTGLHLPVIRSLVMATVVVVGLSIGRRSVSLRGLALAALAMLVWHPEYVLSAAFQMSFVAVMALAAGYEVAGPKLAAFRALTFKPAWLQLAHRATHHALVLGLTSLLAGLSTLPVVMAHFGQIQPFFVIANLFVVPVMALWVMPLGLMALLLVPFHGEALALIPMGWGVRLIIASAHVVAQWPAARIMVPAMPPWALGLIILGLCWLCLWRQTWRFWGLAPVGVGLLVPFLVLRPTMMISPDGGMVGLYQQKILWVGGQSRDAAWLGAAWQQAVAAQTIKPFPVQGEVLDGALSCDSDGEAGLCFFSAANKVFLLRLHDRSDGMQGLPDTVCKGVDAVISSAPLRQSCPDVPLRLDRFSAWRNGAQTVFVTAKAVDLQTDRAWQGTRPWVLKPGGHGQPNLPLAQAE